MASRRCRHVHERRVEASNVAHHAGFRARAIREPPLAEEQYVEIKPLKVFIFQMLRDLRPACPRAYIAHSRRLLRWRDSTGSPNMRRIIAALAAAAAFIVAAYAAEVEGKVVPGDQTAIDDVSRGAPAIRRM